MSKNQYIGITIGPIFDTINLTSSPAALWAASYIFSSLAKNVCKILTEEYGVLPEQIISPYYNKDDELLKKNDGIGLFHDRIIFCAEGFDTSKMPEVRRAAIVMTAEQFGLEKHIDYLNEYIMLESVGFEADNPILESATLLDCIELAKPFVFEETRNPILDLFENANQGEGAQTGKNEAVKALTTGFRDFQLKKPSGSLKSISDIVQTGTGYKKFKYYALLRSDGDNMGQIIASLNTDSEITSFSKTCLEYCSEVASAAGGYGGVTIYSGGDDLLALLPCENNGRTVFDFVAEANAIFKRHFSKYNKPTSLSFGIAIAYNSFPLYEALEQSADLLFGTAKAVKNCIAVNLQKHSGQSAGLLIPNSALESWQNLSRHVAKEKDETLLSAMHKLALFETVFNGADDYRTIHNLFINTFDAEDHTDNNFVHTILPEVFRSLQANKEQLTVCAINNGKIVKNNSVLTMQSMLRLQKFFIEKGGE